jgi:mycoredoxin
VGYVEVAVTRTAIPARDDTGETMDEPTRSDAGDPRVIMYCRSWCGDCKRAKRWLDGQGIAYEEIDIELVPEAAETVRSIAGKIITPTFEIGDETCVDFDEPKLRRLLGAG